MWLNVEHLILNHITYSREPLNVLTNNICRTLTLDVLSGSWATNNIDDSSTLTLTMWFCIGIGSPYSLHNRILKTFHHMKESLSLLNWSTSLRSWLRHEQKHELLSVKIIFKTVDTIFWSFSDMCNTVRFFMTIYLLQSCLSWVESSC